MSSSVDYPIGDLIFPFMTGSGPSWGCTSIIVYSDKGVWVGHIWEGDLSSDFQNSVRNFLQNGYPGGGFNDAGDPLPEMPSLRESKVRYFGSDALFVKAIITAPNAERPKS